MGNGGTYEIIFSTFISKLTYNKPNYIVITTQK